MNAPGINPEKFHFQVDSQSDLEPQLLALKESLRYCLGSFLVSNYEVLDNPFTVLLSQNQSDIISDADTSNQSSTSSDFIDWRTLPLNSKVIETSLTYICALPQMLRRNYDFYSAKSLRLQTQRLAEELNQFQLQSICSLVTLPSATFTLLSALWNEFTAESEKPGWIVFTLSNQGLWYWLEQFQTNVNQTKPKHTLFISRLPANEADVRPSTHLNRQSSIECSRSHAHSTTSFLNNSQLRSLKDQLLSYTKLSPLNTRGVSSGKTSSGEMSSDEISSGEVSRDETVVQLFWQMHYTASCCNSLIQQVQSKQPLEQITTCVHRGDQSKLPKALLESQNALGSQERIISSAQPQNTDQLSVLASSYTQALILEIVRTIDTIYADTQKPDSLVVQNHAGQGRARRKSASKKALLPLKQSARLCCAFDNFYRADWPQTSSTHSLERPKLTLSKQDITTRSHEMIQILTAAKETLQILLQHYQEPTVDSL